MSYTSKSPSTTHPEREFVLVLYPTIQTVNLQLTTSSSDLTKQITQKVALPCLEYRLIFTILSIHIWWASCRPTNLLSVF